MNLEARDLREVFRHLTLDQLGTVFYELGHELLGRGVPLCGSLPMQLDAIARVERFRLARERALMNGARVYPTS